MRTSSYDKFPCVQVPEGKGCCVQGWTAIAERLQLAIAKRSAGKTVLVVECYTGVDEASVLHELERVLSPSAIFRAADAMLSPDKIDALVQPFLGDDPVFGFLSCLTLPQFFDNEKLAGLLEMPWRRFKGSYWRLEALMAPFAPEIMVPASRGEF